MSTGKHLCRSFFFKDRLQHSCFSVNIAKILWTFFKGYLLWLLLQRQLTVTIYMWHKYSSVLKQLNIFTKRSILNVWRNSEHRTVLNTPLDFTLYNSLWNRLLIRSLNERRRMWELSQGSKVELRPGRIYFDVLGSEKINQDVATLKKTKTNI